MKEYAVLPTAICVMCACCSFMVGSMNWRQPGRRHKFAIAQLSLGVILTLEAVTLVAITVFT